jgi:glycosyltransferase involved in cell wall biosynthesis
MRQGNHLITVLAANTPKHKTADPTSMDGVTICPADVNTTLNPAAMILNLMFSSLPYQVSRFRSNLFKNKLKELLSRENYDLIQLEGPHLGIYLPLIRKYSHARVVLRAHNAEHLLWNEIARDSGSWLKKAYLKKMAQRFRKFETWLVSQADGIIPITENDCRHLILHDHLKKYCVIPFSISADDYKPQPPSFPDSLCYIGALDWIPNQKGLLWFLEEVWPAIHANHQEVTFHVAGRNAPRWLKSRFSAENVYFYGETDNASDFMNRYQVMVIPVFSGSGVRIKILEAMALKKPIITTSKGAEGLNTTGKELIIADGSETFLAAIVDLLKNKIRQESLGEAGRAFISKEFDKLALANKAEEFYRTLLTV